MRRPAALGVSAWKGIRSAAALACVLAWNWTGSAAAFELPGAGPAEAMARAAQTFLESLSPEQRAMAVRAFDDPARLDWQIIPKPERKGLQIKEMNEEQRALCHALLRSALSEDGYAKAVGIMSLENNLREGEKGRVGSPLRDPERYFLTIFGTPSAEGRWGWSFEGHHLSLNFTLDGGRVTGETPSVWGANPAEVKTFEEGGPPVGARMLEAEERLGFELVQSLSPDQFARALLAPQSPEEYRSPGSPQAPREQAKGLEYGAMSDAQREALATLVKAYLGRLAGPIAAERMKEIEESGLDRVRFAWAGATKPGVGHYYRVQGPTFVLEFVNHQKDPAGNVANHIHCIWRSMKGDFGIWVN